LRYRRLDLMLLGERSSASPVGANHCIDPLGRDPDFHRWHFWRLDRMNINSFIFSM
jgi:hypothetical protein